MDIDIIDQRVSEIVKSQDVAEARLLLAELSVEGVSPEGDDDAAWLMRQLLFLRLPQLELERATWLLQHYVLEGFEIEDYNFPARVQDVISLVFDTDKRADMLHHFLTAVETSDELLGDKPLTIDAAEVAPMVQNWIKDYNYWPTENKFRQSIDAVNYASKAPNPQKLAAEDRALLIKLLGWYDEIRNSLYDYEASEDIDLEQYPNFDPRLLTASIDEFESPESARKALDKALAVKRSNPLAGIPVTGSARSERFIPTAMPSSSNAPRPNIQGVLSNAPIKKEDGTSKGVAPVIQGKPRVAPLTPLESQKPSPAPASTAPSAPPKNKPVALPVSSAPSPARPVLPARAPENLPMVEPEDLPAVRLPKIPSRPAKKTSTSFQGAASSLPVTLNMDRIQDEVKRNKIAAQADIDERLANLKKRSTSKN